MIVGLNGDRPRGVGRSKNHKNKNIPRNNSMGQLAIAMSAKLNTPKKPLLRAQRSGISFPRYFTARLEAGKTPYDEVQWETANRHHRQRQRRGHLRAARCRGSGRLVADGDQHRRQQVFPRQDGIAGARNERRAAGPPRRRHDRRLGHDGRYFQTPRGRREFPQ